MNIRSFILADNSRLEPIRSEDLSPEWLTDEAPRWIDVEAPKAEKLREFLAPLGIPQVILEGCLEPTDEPELARFENIVYIEFPLIRKKNELEQDYVSIIFLPTTLITIHKDPISDISRLKIDLKVESIVHRSSISGLLYELIVQILKQNYLLFQDVRKQINKLAKSIDEDPDSVDLGDILNLRSIVDLFVSVIEDQNYCIEILLASESKSVTLGEQRQHFKDLSRSVQNALRTLNRYDSRLNDLHQHYMLTLQDRTNSRLKVLTIISAIFLPLTLLAGIYGMYFEYMPELDDHYSYFLVLGVMVLIAMTMMFFFYRRGWFK